MKQHLVPRVLALGVLAALAVPATAGAHPAVYQTTAKVLKPGAATPPTAADLIDQTRYAVGNDGYTAVLRESNGKAGGGLVNYLLMPAGTNSYRATLTPAQKLLNATDVQAHATCATPALATTEAIVAWQAGEAEAGTDPFYAYVPFQKATAGFGDKPEKWIPVVKALTGVDLDTVADPAAACAGLGGTYYAADAVQSSSAQFSSAVIAAAVKTAVDPLTATNTQLSTQVTTLLAEAAALQAGKAAAEQAGAAAEARTKSALTPLKVSVITRPTVARFSSAGIPVALSGPAGAQTRVRVMLSAAKAKALRLRSRVLATATTPIKADGTQSLTLTPSKTATAAIKRATGSLGVTVDALAGDRSSTVTASLKR